MNIIYFAICTRESVSKFVAALLVSYDSSLNYCKSTHLNT